MPSVLKISVDENNVIRLTLGGGFDKERLGGFQKWADQVHQTMLDVYKKTGEKVRFFTDAAQLESMDDEILNIYNELLKKDLPYVRKSATFGAKGEMLIKLTTLSVTSDRANFQHFPSREKALEWLME